MVYTTATIPTMLRSYRYLTRARPLLLASGPLAGALSFRRRRRLSVEAALSTTR